ncbi:macro domain-containing protein [Mucilaginibacter phyllosphaerae]
MLVNTVNLVGVMGKGIALAFKQAFPYNSGEYAKACKFRTLGVGGLCVVKDYHMFYGHKTMSICRRKYIGANHLNMTISGLVWMRSKNLF